MRKLIAAIGGLGASLLAIEVLAVRALAIAADQSTGTTGYGYAQAPSGSLARANALRFRAVSVRMQPESVRRSPRNTFAWLIPILCMAWPFGWSSAAWGADADGTLTPGDRFRDCDVCPEMVVVPAGEFVMGSPPGEVKRLVKWMMVWRDGTTVKEQVSDRQLAHWANQQGPQHRVRIPRPFAVGVFEVSFAEWDACQRESGCVSFGGDEGWGRGDRPAINVSWEDAQAYVRWLSRRTGSRYRLLSESEWEYVARAGTTTPYHFGHSISGQVANCCTDYGMTLPGGAFPANGFGLHDVHGNVWEWVQDCWNESYEGAPTDGGAWTTGDWDCSMRVLRGGSWNNVPGDLRSAGRGLNPPDSRSIYYGFRVARTLTP